MSALVFRLVLLAAAALVGTLLVRLLPYPLRVVGFERTNYQGHSICTAGGLLFLIAALPWLWIRPDPPATAAACAAVGFGTLGLIDDRWGTAEFRGLRGHLTALRRGRVTTGLLKALGGLALGGGLGWWLSPNLGALLAAPLIALSANAMNLLDLRPLRALKLFWLLGGAMAPGGLPVLAQLLGLSLPYSRLEARRVVMLGDTGSNALGGVLGVSAVALLPEWAEALAVAVLAAFHVWAERHSLTAWIDAHPWARRLDGWGWRGESDL